MNTPAGFGPRAKREAPDVPEPRVVDRTLDRLLGVRKQRLERLEREQREARRAWRAGRELLAGAKRRWREEREAAAEFWRGARADFFAMETSSGQFRAAKAGFERMKRQAAEQLLAWREQRAACRADGGAYFAAHEQLRQARRQQEKLSLFRDEIQSEALRHVE